MSAELRLHDVAVTLGGVRILDDVSLDVHAGETFGIIGPNGAGKTTVLNVISGVVPLQAGSVELDGVDLARTRPHRRRARHRPQPPDHAVLPRADRARAGRPVRGAEHAGVGAAPAGPPGERGAAMDALERLALADVAHTRVGELPSGVQKLVDLARAILAGRSVLLLDEPTSGVGAHERRLVRSVLDELGAEGRTIVVVDHDPGFVASCCERVVCMNFGAVLVTGPPDEVLASDEVRRSYLGDVA